MTRWRISHLRIGLMVAMLSASGHVRGRADVFELASGGQVHGVLLNPAERPRKTYRVRTQSGVHLSLATSQVKQTIRLRPDRQRYNQIAPVFPNTVHGQWALAEWCRQHSLVELRKVHLRRVLELDPDHAPAQRGLGYTLFGQRWLKGQELMIEQGYQRYLGRWRLVQEIQLLREEDERQAIRDKWIARLRLWRTALTGNQSEEARHHIVSIGDAAAVGSLIEMLCAEPFPEIRLVYVEALGRIADAQAARALVETSIGDVHEEVRLSSLDEIVRIRSPDVIRTYVRALRDRENHKVNRAAVALAQLKDSTTISPLIEALVTSHILMLKGPGSPDAITSTFTGDGAHFDSGGGTKVIQQNVPNQQVLSALVAVTEGVNFSFDQQAWRYWYEAQKEAETILAGQGIRLR